MFEGKQVGGEVQSDGQNGDRRGCRRPQGTRLLLLHDYLAS